MKRIRKLIQKSFYFIMSVLAGAFLGFFTVALLFGGALLPEEYGAMPGRVNLLIFAGSIFLAVAVHEAGHFIGFVMNGVPMRALFITSFLFIKESGRWKLKFRPNNVTLIGGIAIPDLEAVKNREHFDRLQRAYAQAILAGPVASVLLCFLVLAFGVPSVLLSDDINVKSVLFITVLSIVLITIFVLITCIAKTETIIGDFPAYRLCRASPSFVAMQLYQYAVFSSDPDSVRKENVYLKGLILDDLKMKHQQRDFGIFTLNAVDMFLVEYLTGLSAELPEVVRDYIHALLLNPAIRRKVPASEVGTILWFHIVRFLNTKEEHKRNALSEFEFLRENINLKSPVNQYLIKQAEHFLGLADHSAFLRDKKNIRISSVHGLWKNFEGYYIDEMRLNGIDQTDCIN